MQTSFFPQRFFSLFLYLLILFLVTFLVVLFAQAWQAPTANPPSEDLDEILTTSDQPQSKEGDLNIGPGLKYWITKLGDSFALKNDAGEIKFVLGQDGKVGIGTTTPQYELDVQGQINAFQGLCISGDCKSSWAEVGGGYWSANGNDIYNTNSGNVGIGLTMPKYTLDVKGSIRASKSLTAGINVESLSGNKTLTPGTDPMYQYLNPNGANRTIYLATSTARAGDRFVIKNTASYSSSNYLSIKQGTSKLDEIYAGTIKEFIFDGTNWVGVSNATGESGRNVAIGKFAAGHNYGSAVGWDAYAPTYGAALGPNTNACIYGVAAGYRAYGYVLGAAVGKGAYGYNYGAAVGYEAKGMRFGAALGYKAGHNIATDEDRYNILIGAYSGYRLTQGTSNIIIGYKAGEDSFFSPTVGSNNILIGTKAWTPTHFTSDFLNIGGLIFGTGLSREPNSLATGNVGIGVTNPNYKLQVAGDIAPSSDNAYDLGKSTLRWANLYAASTTVGDLIFNNNFRIVETQPEEEIQGIVILSLIHI